MVFDRPRPHGQALWRSLAHVEQERFLRHLVRYWDTGIGIASRHRSRTRWRRCGRALGWNLAGRCNQSRRGKTAHRCPLPPAAAYRRRVFDPRRLAGQRHRRRNPYRPAAGRCWAPCARARVAGSAASASRGARPRDRCAGQRSHAAGAAMRIGTLWESWRFRLRGQAQALADHLRATPTAGAAESPEPGG